MFTINIDNDDECIDIKLFFKNDTIEFEFSPESCQDNFEIGKEGTFSLPCYNGANEFTWDESVLRFHLAHYGSGFGGKMAFSVQNTPQIMKSFQECLTKWKEAVKDN